MDTESDRESRKRALLEKARNPENIPGIYNYCDRWCERCPFTSRCLNCELDEGAHLNELEADSEAFWNTIMESLETAFELIRDMAEEAGIDLDHIEPVESEDDGTVVPILGSMSRHYADRVTAWMQENESLLLDKARHQEPAPGLRLVHSQPVEGPVPVKEIVEVISWYQYQIHVKIKRALSSKHNERKWSLDDFPKDSDGSAKVALIGIDRSMGAWGTMAGYFPKDKGVLKIIDSLTRLRDMTEKEFPHARAFKRPGFDDAPVA
ncbi:MAG: hypothetical protein K9M96_10775 [Deltaproteobacteria bacterium]|nr:hypothetical protein [Deltaproteobacteria bacterium]